MLVYWLMFFIPVLAQFGPGRLTIHARDWTWRATCVLFALLIGLRFEVGGDWFVYADYYRAAAGEPFASVFTQRDLAYELLVWLSAYHDMGMGVVNLVCATVVMIGTYHFCRRQPRPWLALIVAVPYMLIVVAMGYTRQSAALGLELLALVALGDGRLRRFFILIACAALFHKSAVVLLPLGIFASTHKTAWTIVAMVGMSLLLGGALLLEQYEALLYTYSEMESEGGAIRVAMNAIPALLFLRYARRLSLDDSERRLWTWVAVFSLACIPLVAVASTAADRVALYFLPIQVFVYSRIECLFRDTFDRTIVRLIIVSAYGLVEWVLLNKATNVSVAWVPYQNVVFPW